jgi:hypothetical protein
MVEAAGRSVKRTEDGVRVSDLRRSLRSANLTLRGLGFGFFGQKRSVHRREQSTETQQTTMSQGVQRSAKTDSEVHDMSQREADGGSHFSLLAPIQRL